ncbi:MAG: cytochrome c oxidase subunit 3 [Bacteroidetes bacterium]|nr:cytochrome c oxidase subunit 3 [Bacteroidota bacterium]
MQNSESRPLRLQPKEAFRMNPREFLLWLLIVASIMLFAAFTSAYILHRKDGLANNQWIQFDLPVQFTYSLITAGVSSLFMLLAYRAAKNDELAQNRIYLAVTLILGIVFCLLQYSGWKYLTAIGLPFVPHEDMVGGISASFLYVVTVFHFLHVIGGLFLLGFSLIRSLRLQVHRKNLLLIRVTNTYWHFVGVLWIYLFLFLYFAR